MFTDAILYVSDFAALVAYMDEHHPDCLERDEEGNIQQPPVITGFSRTPAQVNGNSVLVYARLRPDEVDQWRNTPDVEVLGEAEHTGKGTGAVVYQQVFDDPEKDAKYKSVYDYSPREEDDGEGGTVEVTPPKMFGLLAGA